jgi:hypothetical protein
MELFRCELNRKYSVVTAVNVHRVVVFANVEAAEDRKWASGGIRIIF